VSLLKWTLCAGALALLSCSARPTVDPLEAKAMDGDPVAVCQLAARILHDCALKKQEWEKGELAERPRCIDEGVSERYDSYFDKAVEKLEGHLMSQHFLRFDRVMLAANAVFLSVQPADQVIPKIEEIQQGCVRHAELSKF
jgi:hypothetical protein